MKLRRAYLASTAALGLLSLVGISNQAHAGAYAYADLKLSAFEAKSVTGGTLGSGGTTGGTVGSELTNANTASGGVAGGNIVITGATDNFGASASIGFNPPASSANVPSPAGECAPGGGSCPVNPFGGLAPPIQNFSQAATSLSGAPVIDVNAPPNEGGGKSGSGGATAESSAQSQLTGTNFAGANSSVSLNAGFTFKLLSAQTIDLSFTALLTKIAGLDAAGLAALATSSWGITITDTGPSGTSVGTNVLTWNPNGTPSSDATGLSGLFCGKAGSGCLVVDDPYSLNSPDAGLDSPSVGQNTVANALSGFFDVQVALNNTDIYQLTIHHTTTTSVTSVAAVPEPNSVALLAAGLLGFGAFVRRRRRSKA